MTVGIAARKTIRQVVKETGLSVHTLRYERVGLIPPVQRAKSGQGSTVTRTSHGSDSCRSCVRPGWRSAKSASTWRSSNGGTRRCGNASSSFKRTAQEH